MTNGELVDAWYQALATSDLALFQSVHDPDVIYDISGHSPISGRHRGLSALMTKVLPPVFAGINQADFQFCKKRRIMAESATCIVGIMEADGTAANGRRYDQRYVHMFEFRNGRIGRVIEFFDTALAAEAVLADVEPIAPDGPFEL